ncbi:hypothetical protein KDA00_00740 [Candidatus Saccharibacteria bacterium]|nr:hypothetical protein [Candidatus Saccharibacteria bacterium]
MNELRRLSDFQEILNNYHVSESTRRALIKTRLVLMCGVTSSGRNTIIGELMKIGDYYFITSDTTRKPRINMGNVEKNGEEYWFKSEDEFIDGLRKGEYVEAAIIHDQQVSGISIKEIEHASKQHEIAITDIEPAGVESIIKIKPDTKCIFMIPPSFETWLKRIDLRGRMTEIELIRRLKSAVKEINHALNNDHFIIIVNNEFHETAEMVKNIFTNIPDQTSARVVAKNLLKQTQDYLNENDTSSSK